MESENQWISDDGEDLDDTKVTFQKQGMYGETAQNTVDNNESDNTADVDKTVVIFTDKVFLQYANTTPAIPINIIILDKYTTL